jgi:hypothetical protein
MLLTLLQWIQNSGVFVYLRSSAYLYPVILALHVSSISLFGGLIVLTDLSLLGWAGILTAGRAIGYVPAPPGLHFL